MACLFKVGDFNANLLERVCFMWRAFAVRYCYYLLVNIVGYVKAAIINNSRLCFFPFLKQAFPSYL